MVASPVQEEVHYPNGRVSLTSPDEIASSQFANGDLAPLPIVRRTCNTYNYAALWVGMSHHIPTYLLGGRVRDGPDPLLRADHDRVTPAGGSIRLGARAACRNGRFTARLTLAPACAPEHACG